MRLPSHSYDKNDLARSLSVAVDGPEEVIEAEDYLQPTPRASVEIPTTPVSSKVCLLISSFPLYWKSIFYNFFLSYDSYQSLGNAKSNDNALQCSTYFQCNVSDV